MATRFAFPGSNYFYVRPGDEVTVYTDAGATVPAVIEDLDEDVIEDSVLTVTSSGVLPAFTGDVPDLYAKVTGAATARHLHSDTADVAAGIPFDNTASGLTGEDLQAAIDEIVVRLVALES